MIQTRLEEAKLETSVVTDNLGTPEGASPFGRNFEPGHNSMADVLTEG